VKANLLTSGAVRERLLPPSMSGRSVTRLVFFRCLSVVVLTLAVLSASSSAQQRFDPFNDAASGTNTSLTTGYDSRGGGVVVLLTVYAENNKTRLDRQSVVKLTNQTTQNVNWQTTTDQSEATFGDVPFGHYEIEVSAVGYLSGHKELQVISSLGTINLDLVLQRDPTAIQFGFLEGALPSKARKDTKHGVSALKSGNLKQADKWLNAAYDLAPANADLNFLMGYLRYQQKDFGHAQTFLGTAADLNPHDVQSLTLLGRLNLQKEDYVTASSTLEKAISADSEYWMAHDLLAGTYLKQKKYEQARQQADLAILKSKNNASSSRLVLGQALVNLGQRQEGIDTLKSFLKDSPKSPTAPQVTNLIAELERNAPNSFPGTVTTHSNTPLTGIDPLLVYPDITFTRKPWQPAGIDETRLSVAPGVTCPDNVIEMSGERVEELVKNVSRIAALAA
jgi:tetratricopeptide (TPR) repeat protein